MIVQTQNRAAEQLRVEMEEGFNVSQRGHLLDEALAAERHALVKRLRGRIKRLSIETGDQWYGNRVEPDDLYRILDEEAVR